MRKEITRALCLLQPLLVHVLDRAQLPSAIRVTSSWQIPQQPDGAGNLSESSKVRLSHLAIPSNIKHISLPSSKSGTALLEQAVFVLTFCPVLMKSCQSAAELVRFGD